MQAGVQMRIYAATGRVHSRACVLHRIRTCIYRGTKEGEEREKRNRVRCVHGGQGKTEESEQGKAGHGVAMQDREGHRQQGARKKGIKKERQRRWRLG